MTAGDALRCVCCENLKIFTNIYSNPLLDTIYPIVNIFISIILN